MKIIVAIDGFAALGNPATYQSVKDDILERDKIDAAWTHPAKDAIRIDNGSKPLNEIIQYLLTLFYKLTENWRSALVRMTFIDIQPLCVSEKKRRLITPDYPTLVTSSSLSRNNFQIFE